MNKLALLFGVLVASQAQSQTLDIGTLSLYERAVHRYGWCSEAYYAEGKNNQPDLYTYRIGDIINLLRVNGFTNADDGGVGFKAREDLQAQLIIGGKILSQEDLDACFEDLKNMLAENYVPNFKYMEN